MLRWRPYLLAFSPLVSFQPQTISQSRPTSHPGAATSSDTKLKQGKPNRTKNGVYINSRDKPVLGLKTVQPVQGGNRTVSRWKLASARVDAAPNLSPQHTPVSTPRSVIPVTAVPNCLRRGSGIDIIEKRVSKCPALARRIPVRESAPRRGASARLGNSNLVTRSRNFRNGCHRDPSQLPVSARLGL